MAAALHAFTVVVSALLLLLVQPMLGKRILPWFGGSPGVWSSCLLFFQAGLFLGYATAHGLVRRASPRVQLAALLGLSAVSAMLLPLGPNAGERPDLAGAQPELAVLGLLAMHVGLPYLLLSSTAPLVQHWYERATSRSPYALYALSNAGSLLGLLAYPFLLEPAFDLERQSAIWSALFALYALGLLGVCSFALARRSRAPADTAPERAPAPLTIKRQLSWFALAALPSVLLVSGTNYITVDVAAGPLLWVLPLGLYLMSFIAAFGAERLTSRGLLLPIWAASTAALGLALFAQGMAPLAHQLATVLAALFAGCLLCHAELWRARPPAAQLSYFYLVIAAGGAAGGLFVALLAPRLFRGFFELQLAVLAIYVVLLAIVGSERVSLHKRREQRWLWLGLGLGTSLVAATFWADGKDRTRTGTVIEQRRGFYGVLRVTQLADVTVLTHGRIRHGMQFRDPARRRAPTMYYGPESGAGRVLLGHARERARNIGVVGLGVGTIAAYGRPGDRLWFYELNPDVIDVAQQRFSFLRDSAARVQLVQGDGRVVLEREPPREFDVLVADAFSSDSVPAHLLTAEAFSIYLRHLRPDGLLLVNVANRHLEIGRVVAGAARRHGLALRIADTPSDAARGYSRARWAVLARDRAALDAVLPQSEAVPLEGAPVAWTDTFSDLLSVLR